MNDAFATSADVFRRGGQVLLLQIVLQARGLIQVPFLTRSFRSDELGAWTLAMSIVSLAGVPAVLGLNTGFFLNYVKLEAARTRAAVASVLAVSGPLVIAASAATVFVLRSEPGGRWLRGASDLAVPIGWLIAGNALRELALIVPRARQDVAFHALTSLWIQYGGLVAGLVLVVRGHGPRGFLLGMAAAALSGAFVGLVYSLRRSGGSFAWDAAFCGAVVRSSLPVVPMALAQMALLSLDYAFVSRFQGPAALATYGLAYTFASPVMLALAVINFTLLPEYVARHRSGDAVFVSFVESILAWGWAGGLATVAAAAALGPAVIEVVAGRAYRAAGDLLPAIAAAYVLFTLAQTLHLVRTALLANVRRTAAVAVVAALFNAALNVWAVPRYGIRGAAATTLLSFLLYYLGMTTGLGTLFVRSAWARAWGPLFALSAGPVALLLEPSAATRALSALAPMATALLVARRLRRRAKPSQP